MEENGIPFLPEVAYSLVFISLGYCCPLCAPCCHCYSASPSTLLPRRQLPIARPTFHCVRSINLRSGRWRLVEQPNILANLLVFLVAIPLLLLRLTYAVLRDACTVRRLQAALLLHA